MKKVYSLGLLILVLMLVVAMTVACGTEEETTTTVADVTETTVAAADGEPGIAFKDMGDNVVYITDSPEPGMAFPVTTSGEYASEIWAVDASGARIADFTTEDGYVDYSSVVGEAVKIVIQGPFGDPFEYTIP